MQFGGSYGSKEFKLIYDIGGSKMVRNVPVPPGERARFAISDDEVLELARWAVKIEDHYRAKAGRPCPMDMEWAKDGHSGQLFIVQARPETVQSQKRHDVLESYQLTNRGRVLVTGRSVGDKIATGPVRKIQDVQQLNLFKKGEVLVTDKTDPDWEPVMKLATAIVTNRGGRTCHAAIVSRELGLPAIVGTEHGTDQLADGQPVTVSCAEGDTGFVYEGSLPFQVNRVELQDLPRPKTKVMVNVKLMIPFCRTVEEAKKVQAVMAEYKLARGQNGLEIYVMCEIPSNVISAAAFAEVFDGFSIGSNDLTQLLLGVDRDSAIVAHIFDERNPAVMTAIADVIRTVKAAGRKIGICGQAPSDYPEFAEFLVRAGIDSISLNPDAVLKTAAHILSAERTP